MSRLALIVRTVWRLVLRNVAWVVIYKLRLKLGWRPGALQTLYPDGLVIPHF